MKSHNIVLEQTYTGPWKNKKKDRYPLPQNFPVVAER